MMRLHDNLSSGHGYKVRLLLAQLGVPCKRIEYDIDRAETHSPEFLGEINPNGRVPVLETGDAKFLPESNVSCSTSRRAPPTSLRDGSSGLGSCSGCSSSTTAVIRRTPALNFRAAHRGCRRTGRVDESLVH
jgi:hypothetical protein